MKEITYAKIPDLLARMGHKWGGKYHGEPISCITTNVAGGDEWEDKSVSVIRIANGQEDHIVCQLVHENTNHPSDYWNFKLDSICCKDGIYTSQATQVSLDANSWLYFDANAKGTYTYNEKEGLETLVFTTQIHNGYAITQTITWKIPAKQLTGKTYRALIEQKQKKGTTNNTYREMVFTNDSLLITEYVVNQENGVTKMLSEKQYYWEFTDEGYVRTDKETRNSTAQRPLYTHYCVLNTKLIEWERLNKDDGSYYDPYNPVKLKKVKTIVYEQIME